jgi:hypothetical protein
VADLAVGAPRADYGATVDAGEMRFFSGRDGHLLHRARLAQTGCRYGSSVVRLRNTDQDGAPDWLVGAPFYNTSCTDAGRVSRIGPDIPPSIRKAMISEVSWGDPDGLEITNFDTQPRDLAGWVVKWRDGSTLTSSAINQVLAPGQSIVVKEPSGSIAEAPAGTVILSILPSINTSSNDFTVALVDPEGLVVDEVHVTGTNGVWSEGGLGGLMRTPALRTAATPTSGAVGEERIWGLDSDSGLDWTEQTNRSFGLENRSSGPRGTDSVAVPAILISETDDSPDLIEFRNVSGASVDMQGFYLLCSANQGQTHAIIRPWTVPTVVGNNEYFVIGEGAPPAEMPGGTQYVDLTTLGLNIPWTNEEYDCALYDNLGRLVDLMRATGSDDHVVHNDPRAPSAWSDFTGAAPRIINSGDQAVARTTTTAAADTDSGADWRPVFARTMGTANSGFTGLAGLGSPLDVRLSQTGFIINAGPANAGAWFSILFSAGHSQGLGPILGLGLDALGNWLAINTAPGLSGTLDARGSARLDLPPSIPAGVQTDDVFILQGGGVGGPLVALTKVLEFDT